MIYECVRGDQVVCIWYKETAMNQETFIIPHNASGKNIIECLIKVDEFSKN